MSERDHSQAQPAHLGYPGIWELAAGPNPDLLADYLEWVVSDKERFASAVGHTMYYPPGFHGLLVAIQKEAGAPTHSATLQLNFYDPRYPGDEEPHGHSRDAFSSWYAPQGSHQILTRYQVIPDEAPRFRGLPVEERVVMAMNIGDRGDGERPVYMPTELDRALILARSVTNVASLGSQRFDSTEVHHAGFEGKGVAISAHYKGPEEVDGLNTFEGLVHYKSMSLTAAAQLVAARNKLRLQLESSDTETGNQGVRLAPSTALYPRPENVDYILERGAIPPAPAEITSELIIGALDTARYLRRAA